MPSAAMAIARAGGVRPLGLGPFERRGARWATPRRGQHALGGYPVWSMGGRFPIVLVLPRTAHRSSAGRGKEQLSGPRGERRARARRASILHVVSQPIWLRTEHVDNIFDYNFTRSGSEFSFLQISPRIATHFCVERLQVTQIAFA
jgi:hypothetical protein